MFKCERCGSGYSSMHAAALENCPRCQFRDRVAAPLVFKAFEFPDETSPKPQRLPLREAGGRDGASRAETGPRVRA